MVHAITTGEIGSTPSRVVEALAGHRPRAHSRRPVTRARASEIITAIALRDRPKPAVSTRRRHAGRYADLRARHAVRGQPRHRHAGRCSGGHDDIRASTRRRLARIAVLPTPHSERLSIARWLALEQHVAAPTRSHISASTTSFPSGAPRRATLASSSPPRAPHAGPRSPPPRRRAPRARTPARAGLHGGPGGEIWQSGGILGSRLFSAAQPA